MTAILTLIYCWLQEFFFSLTDWGLGIWDSLLSVADSTLATIGTAGLTLPVIPDQYAWVLGATGMSQALAILASAMGTRFILQTIPFVRWGVMNQLVMGWAYAWTVILALWIWVYLRESSMIELYEGVPGSGKSYHAICEKFLPWVKQGRRLYIAVDGIYLDRLALFTGIELSVLEQQITLWKDSVEVLQAFPHVEPGSAVIIDEAQTVFRSMQKVEPGLLRWLETHRHYGVDILLMSQDFRQMSQGVTRLIEATVKFRKLSFVGLSKKYQGKVRGNPEDNEVIRAFVGTYSPAVYAYYSSYASAAIREGKRSHTVFKSARVAIGIAAGLFAIGLMVWRPWSSLSASKPITAGSTAVPTTTIGAPANGSASLLSPLGMSPPAPATPAVPKRPVRILGGAGMSRDRQGWRYLLDSGEILTAAQITGRYGVSVSEVYEDGLMRLIGEGVFYGSAGD